MNEARHAGFNGPEYEDEPEWIFAKVRDLQHNLREATDERDKLRRQLREQAPLFEGGES